MQDGDDANERLDENFTIRITRSMRRRIDELAHKMDRGAGYVARKALERSLPEMEKDADK